MCVWGADLGVQGAQVEAHVGRWWLSVNTLDATQYSIKAQPLMVEAQVLPLCTGVP
jgi:hypothetical protein